MKKVFLFIALMVTISTNAQNVFDIDRDVTFSGSLLGFCKSKEVSKETATFYKDTKWFIKNARVGSDNYVSFWIETNNGRQSEYNSWKGHNVVVTIHQSDGRTHYFVSDDTFRYLTAVETDDGIYGIQLFTTLKE